MVDIHSHVLPGMDDGSKSVEESIQMLKVTVQQGIRQIAATPHFYPADNSPEQFLDRRAKAEKRLRDAWQPWFPELRIGAEVYYFEGMSHAEALDDLRIEGTELLLLEMPFAPWSERMVREIEEIQARSGITVLMAHIERYFRFQKSQVWEELMQTGVRMQCNAEFFLHWKTRRKALRMLKAGKIHFLGSDCHNMRSRQPVLGEALSRIGDAERQRLEETISAYLPGID